MFHYLILKKRKVGVIITIQEMRKQIPWDAKQLGQDGNPDFQSTSRAFIIILKLFTTLRFQGPYFLIKFPYIK